MNYLNIDASGNTGGHPFSLNDLTTLAQGDVDLYNAISAQHYDNFGVVMLSPPNISISGGNFSSGSFWVILYGGGGAVKVAANTGTALSVAPGAAFHVRITTSYGADDPVTYQSGAPKNVHATSMGELVHTASPGGNDFPFTHFNLCDWIDGTATFPLSGLNIGISGGFYQLRYRLVSNNTMLLHVKFKGEVTSVVKVTFPLPYLFRNSFTEVVFIENPTNSETIGRAVGAADGLELSFGRIGGSGFTTGAIIDLIGANLLFEMKMRD